MSSHQRRRSKSSDRCRSDPIVFALGSMAASPIFDLSLYQPANGLTTSLVRCGLPPAMPRSRHHRRSAVCIGLLRPREVDYWLGGAATRAARQRVVAPLEGAQNDAAVG